MPDELLSTMQAGELLRVDDSQVRQLCRSGRLGRKVGGTWILRRAEIERYILEIRLHAYQTPRSRGRPPNIVAT